LPNPDIRSSPGGGILVIGRPITAAPIPPPPAPLPRNWGC